MHFVKPSGNGSYSVGIQGNNVTAKDFGNHQNQVCESECITVTDPAIVKTVDNGNPAPGATIVYTLVVSNNADVAASPLVVTDPMPSNVTYVSDDAANDADTTFDSGSATLTWNIASIPAHGSVTLHITATVKSDASGSIVNTATITGFPEQGNSNTGNDSDSASSTVQSQGCTSNCGGGGGGGGGGIQLIISNEQMQAVLGDGLNVIVTWTTNHLATSRVVYDTVSHPYVSSPTMFGYIFTTAEDSSLVTSHAVTIAGLTPGLTYYFRPISHGSPEVNGIELAYSPPGGAGTGTGGTVSGTGPTPQVLGASTTSLPRTGGMPVEGMFYLSWLAPFVERFRRRGIRQS